MPISFLNLAHSRLTQQDHLAGARVVGCGQVVQVGAAACLSTVVVTAIPVDLVLSGTELAQGVGADFLARQIVYGEADRLGTALVAQLEAYDGAAIEGVGCILEEYGSDGQ